MRGRGFSAILMPMADLDFSLQVRAEVYRLFIETGACPAKSDVARSLGRPVGEITEACAKLADAHMLVLQPGTGEVLMANPLSAVPTAFVVETRHPQGARNWYGNCIWDALGVISMLHTDGQVLTSCGCCGERMSVTVNAGHAVAQPPGIVHFALPARRWWDDIVFN